MSAAMRLASTKAEPAHCAAKSLSRCRHRKEGVHKERRIQVAVLKRYLYPPHRQMLIGQSTDQRIFAWDAPLGFIKSGEVLFAPSPHCFVNSGKIRPRNRTGNESAFRLSNRGLEITMPIVRKRIDQDPSRPYVTLGILDCKYDNSPDLLALVLSQHRFPIQPGTAGIELYVSGFEKCNGRGSQFTRLLSVPRHILSSLKHYGVQ